MQKISKTAGFTLLEVLVALAILGTSMYGGLYLLNRSIANAGMLEEKILAHWVAQNALAQVALAGQELEEFDLVDESVTMYGQEFLLSVSTEIVDQAGTDEVEQTKLSVSIRVMAASEPDRVVQQLELERLL